jgi:flagellar M-ring protein FliF
LLADGAGDDGTAGAVIDERKAALERRLQRQVEAIVTSVVGPNRSRVEISTDFDLNRITQTTDKYDPDGKVLRSSQIREEQSSSGDQKDGAVSVSNELPAGAQKPAASDSNTPREAAKKSEEIVNYEISRTTKTEVTEPGRLSRISAAVLVDGSYGKNDKGEVTYTPRSKEELDRIAALVRSAIGFDQKRGDQVEVVNLRFAETPQVPAGEAGGWMSSFQLTKDDIMSGAEMAVMAILGFIVLFTVVRPLVRRIVTPEGAEGQPTAAIGTAAVAGALGAPGMTTAQVTGGGGGGITNSGGPSVSIVGGDEQVAISNRTSAMIDVAKVQGQVHAQSVQKVGELAEKNPHEAVSIIRSWLHEDAA